MTPKPTESPTERELRDLLPCRGDDCFAQVEWLPDEEHVTCEPECNCACHHAPAIASWHDAKVAELKAENERLRESFDEFGPDCAHDNHQPYCRHYKGLRQRLARLTEAARKLKEAVWRACDWPEGGRVDDASEALDAILNEQETA